ncbi:hypothetical protein GCM10009868_08010 [Terrabacter aerolatus]|uniref:Oxidoreductase n=1 Tax=Terrabacter aerolatus TaxID=422442 RepID=A0A512D509_9MICO|nr:SDR family NAD(P)-dependent oxidoreductase [Terrabacter aerolatus]GEO31536.1 hypothetical protein TAE01_33460 [Terrabacter aerolatus]
MTAPVASNPTVLVAGGDRHLGPIVTALTALGARVVLQAQSHEELERAGAVAAAFSGVEVLDTDVRSFRAADHLVAGLAGHGGLDVLLTPPILTSNGPLIELDKTGWRDALTAHQKRAVGLARAAARAFVAQGRGGRVVTFSRSDTFRSRGVEAAAFSAAMLSLTSAIAAPLREHRVTANCLVLGDALAPSPDSPAAKDMVAELVAHLCGPDGEQVNGRFFYASTSDLGLYSVPLAIADPHAMVRFGAAASETPVGELLTPLLNIGKA